MNANIYGVGHIWADSAEDGQTVTYTLPSGCVLTCDGKEVNEPSGFKHSGERATYQIDCVEYPGKPVTAVLDIH